MNQYRVKISVKKPSKKNPSYSQGALVGQVLMDNKYFKGREFLLHRMSLESACEKANEWCKENAVKLGVKPEVVSVKAAQERLAQPVIDRSPQATPELKPHEKITSLLVDALLHSTRRRAVIRHAISSIGVDKVIDMFEETKSDVDALTAEHQERLTKESAANREIATAMFKIQKDTGLDMRSKISDPSVLLIFKELLVESQNRTMYRPHQQVGKYILNGEIWNEELERNPPTTFKLWLHKNNKHDYEELRIGAAQHV
jgi:hypothetical protein